MNYIFLDIDGVLNTINNINLVVYTFEKIAKKRFPFNVQWNKNRSPLFEKFTKVSLIIIDDNIEDIEKVFSSNRIVKTNRKFGFNGNSLIEACYKLLIK